MDFPLPSPKITKTSHAKFPAQPKEKKPSTPALVGLPVPFGCVFKLGRLKWLDPVASKILFFSCLRLLLSVVCDDRDWLPPI